jgi:LuxR family maltose regulon positive regulatory protein
MLDLLSTLASTAGDRTARTHAERLLTAARMPPPSTPTASRTRQVDELSERELDVLRLLASELTGPEIARHLYISLNTLRTHNKHIFTKLQVTTRRAAVRRASELNLL